MQDTTPKHVLTMSPTTILVVLLVTVGAAHNGAPADNLCDPYWDNAIGQPGVDGPSIVTLTTFDDGSGLALYAGGSFSTAGETPANNIAKWDGSSWSALGEGTGKAVWALTEYTGDLIAAGWFETAGGIEASRIARWDGSSWHALGNGVPSGWVDALTVYNGELIAAGSFSMEIDGVWTPNIARWNGESWQPLGDGLTGRVYGLIVYENELIAAGNFLSSGDTVVNGIARWDGSTWHPFVVGKHIGLDDWPVAAGLTIYEGDLIVGGAFSMAGGEQVNNVTRWNGVEWEPIGDGLASIGVWDFAVFGGQLYAGGEMWDGDGEIQTHVARWDGSAWHPLGSGTNNNVHTLTIFGGKLTFGGRFTVAGDLSANRIATWRELGPVAPGDLNCDGVIDGADLLLQLSQWGKCVDPDNCPADLDGDGTVDGLDLLILLSNWG